MEAEVFGLGLSDVTKRNPGIIAAYKNTEKKNHRKCKRMFALLHINMYNTNDVLCFIHNEKKNFAYSYVRCIIAKCNIWKSERILV